MPGPTHALPPTRETSSASTRRDARRSALVGNFVDQFDIFLPVIALGGVPAPGSSIPDGLVFAATLLGRPLGAFALGALADRRGRARVSRGALLGISACTGIMALLPLHTCTWALGVLLVLRFVTGLFLGGQYSAAIPRALMLTAPERRGHLSGAVMAMSPLANAVIAAATMALTALLGSAYTSWGWRLPVVVGALMPLALVLTSPRPRIPGASSRQPPPAKLGTQTGMPRAAPNEHTSAAASPRRGAGNSGTAHVVAALFLLMTGLWLFTMMGVSVLTSSLRDSFSPHDVSLVMLVATAVSVPTMAAAGAVSTRVGRTRFFVMFGLVSCIGAPLAYRATMTAAHTGSILATTLAAAAVQIVTVSAYGPIGVHLAEHFPETKRSRGYGGVYSASIVLPGLYPFWLPTVTRWVGADAAPPLVLCCAGLCLVTGASWLRPSRPAVTTK